MKRIITASRVAQEINAIINKMGQRGWIHWIVVIVHCKIENGERKPECHFHNQILDVLICIVSIKNEAHIYLFSISIIRCQALFKGSTQISLNIQNKAPFGRGGDIWVVPTRIRFILGESAVEMRLDYWNDSSGRSEKIVEWGTYNIYKIWIKGFIWCDNIGIPF